MIRAGLEDVRAALGLTYAGKLFTDGLGLSTSPSVESAGLSPEMEAGRKPRLVESVDGAPLA